MQLNASLAKVSMSNRATQNFTQLTITTLQPRSDHYRMKMKSLSSKARRNRNILLRLAETNLRYVAPMTTCILW